jgi:hypothetical protein
MSVKSAQAVTVDFTTADPTTGAAADADSTPTATLVINGTDNAATVTVTNKATGVYKAAVTLPTLTAGDVVSVRVAATVATVAGVGVVWTDVADTKRVSDLNDFDGTGATLTAAYDHAKDDVLTPLAVVSDAIAALPGAQVGTRIDETSTDIDGDVLGLTTASGEAVGGVRIQAFAVDAAGHIDRSSAIRQTTSRSAVETLEAEERPVGSWELYLPAGTYTLVVTLDGYYDAADGDSEITRTVTVA